MAKKKAKALLKAAQAMPSTKAGKTVRSGKSNNEERRQRKLEQRKREKAKITPQQWAQPAPAHLKGELDKPQIKSRYKTVYEILENKDKKKPLESSVTKDQNPPPGYTFVPVGDPIMTTKCKELSRDRDAMIFIVSTSQEGVSEISEHMHRLGYHFRETIVEDARALLGETVIVPIVPGQVEPIPESQEEINKQADAAIRDLFPRIPNTDRAMILEHAFKKGGLFHGEKTVGLQPDIPLSRRVQLAVLAHIRHTHTRYDQLLRETSWQNARKVVEPICLRIIVEWRGDDENGRDLEDDIVREVVMLTDSEDEEEEEDDDNYDEDDSDEDGEDASESSLELLPMPMPKTQNQRHKTGQQGVYRTLIVAGQNPNQNASEIQNGIASRTRSKAQPKRRLDRRGFHRFQNALDSATPALEADLSQNLANARPRSVASTLHKGAAQYAQELGTQRPSRVTDRSNTIPGTFDAISTERPDPHYSQHRPSPVMMMHRNEMALTSQTEPQAYRRGNQPYHNSGPYPPMEQRPSQVVRGSPQKPGFQDMLLPSIESPSSDGMISQTRIDEQRNIPHRFDRPRESYSRMAVDSRRISPPRRQVIVIDDDSPYVKRQRLVREDDPGHFRPVPSRDYTVRAMSPQPHSHFIRTASFQQEDFPDRRPIIHSESGKGFLGADRHSYHATGSISIYDAPESDILARLPAHYKRDVTEAGHRGEPRIIRRLRSPTPAREYVGEPIHLRQAQTHKDGRNIQHMRMSEESHGTRYVEADHRIIVPRSPTFHVSQTTSRPYDMGPRPAFFEQDLPPEMPQSRFVDPVSRPRDDFIISERPHSSFERENVRSYENPLSRPVSNIPQTRARSPARYEERIVYREGIRQPVGYQQSLPIYEGRIDKPDLSSALVYLPPSTGPSAYGRAPPPRQIVTLD